MWWVWPLPFTHVVGVAGRCMALPFTHVVGVAGRCVALPFTHVVGVALAFHSCGGCGW